MLGRLPPQEDSIYTVIPDDILPRLNFKVCENMVVSADGRDRGTVRRKPGLVTLTNERVKESEILKKDGLLE